MTQTPSSARSADVSGWLEAVLFVLLIGVLSVVYAVASAQGAHVVVFILYSMLIAGSASLLLTRGEAAVGLPLVALLREPLTWAVGFTNIVMEACYFLALVQVPPAEASLLVRLSVPLALVLGVVLFNRWPRPAGWLGGALVLAGLAVLVSGLDATHQAMSLVAGAIAALMVALRSFASEWHPHNRAARSVFGRMRVTGALILITTLVCWPLVLAGMAGEAAGYFATGGLLPRPADLVHGPTLVLAALVGAVMFTAMNYFTFSSVVKIGTQNFLGVSALMPLATLLVQATAAAGGLIGAPSLAWHLLPAFALVVAGVLVLVWSQGRR